MGGGITKPITVLLSLAKVEMMKKKWITRFIQICGFVALCSILAWAQKDSEPSKEGITLSDLGVTEEQKNQIEAMWKLKRQKHVQAVTDLKTFNRLVKDTLIGDKEIRETLKKVRLKRKTMQKQIDEAEEALIKTLSPRAQLHLTVLGILDNGLPRRMTKTSENKGVGQKNIDVPNPIDGQSDKTP